MAEVSALSAKMGPTADRAEIVQRLSSHEATIRGFAVTALYLFGSAVRDELTLNSDVDIFVDFDPDGPFSFVELIRLESYLHALLGRRVDFSTRDGLHPRISRRIEASSFRVF
jgi:uncharacterized protein